MLRMVSRDTMCTRSITPGLHLLCSSCLSSMLRHTCLIQASFVAACMRVANDSSSSLVSG